MKILVYRTTMVLELLGLRRAVEGTVVSGAAVSVTLVTLGGREVAGESWPLPLAPIDGTAGGYRAVLPASLGVAPGAQYRARISAVDGALELYKELPVEVRIGTE
jgi:hypothetical protein